MQTPLTHRLSLFGSAGLLGRALMAAAAFACASGASAAPPTKIVLGYQALWASGGDIFETLRHTNILQLYGFDAEFKTFTSGPPLGEAAVAGAVDNFYAADAPVLRAASRLPSSKVLARSHDSSYAIVAQPDFHGGITDLKGKTLSGLFGTTVFPRAIRQITTAGIADPFRQIHIVNQDIPEAAAALQAKQIDATVTWDPMEEKLRRLGYRSIYDSKPGENFGWLGLTGNWLQKNGDDAAVRFLEAWITAAWWTSNHADEARGWFAKTSGIDRSLLEVADRSDRYLRAPVPDIRQYDFRIDDQTIAGSQSVVDFLVQQKLLPTRIDVKQYVASSYIERAQQAVRDGKTPDLAAIKVIAP
ncbi:ABC-type nitrate/sulfonate/bicarbonate transport system substrate-binding protein [Paraburkholderia sp. JPY465]|uniref:ABC transporter substrate-binding protein n=1 Tax=Paraburkholderia sp. JPY465 TaxID=3042285 RepID=UPI003D1D7D9D